jgi:hypothetical protein
MEILMNGALPLGFATALLFLAAEAWAQTQDESAATDEEIASWAGLQIDDGDHVVFKPPDLRLDFAAPGMFQDAPDADPLAEADQGPVGDQTGTDPRDFGNKFMPYYRYAQNKNGVYINQFVGFGLIAFNPRLALSYEWPLAKRINYGTDFTGSPGGTNPDLPPNGIGPGILEPDGDSTGMGDLIIRIFSRPEALEWKYKEGETDSISLMPTIEFTLPTATEDILGADSFIVAPALTVVADMPGGPPFGLGFIASMNFYQLTAFKDNSRGNVSRYVGRHFWMQPLTKPGPGIVDGLYVLTEFQTIYDFMENDFDAWIAPEFGKIVKEGLIVYAKPGWGIDPEPNDREFTFEFGVRIFY